MTPKKAWWKHPSVAVAAVGAVSALAVAVVNKASNPPTKPTNELIPLLELRAKDIELKFEQKQDYKAQAEFKELHRQNIDAIKNDQPVVSHETTNKIGSFLKNHGIDDGSYNMVMPVKGK